MTRFISAVNECELGTDNCDDAHGTCTDTAESFECSCKAGYTGNGVTCTGNLTIIRGEVQIYCICVMLNFLSYIFIINVDYSFLYIRISCNPFQVFVVEVGGKLTK